MYATTLNGHGEPEVMEWAEVDDLPAPGPGQIAIDVVAAGVNRADVMQRMGFYPPPPGASDIRIEACRRLVSWYSSTRIWSKRLPTSSASSGSETLCAQ